MIVTSEYVVKIPKLIEISNVMKNTERDYYEKDGQDKIKIKVLCHVEFFDGWSNKIEMLRSGIIKQFIGVTEEFAPRMKDTVLIK